jgi:hypothetical protein
MAIGLQLPLAPRARTYLALGVVAMMISRLPILLGEAILPRDLRSTDPEAERRSE